VTEIDGNAWHQDAVAPRSHRSLRAVGDDDRDPAVPPHLGRRRRAIADLGDALRVLVEHATATEMPTDDLQHAAERIRQAAALLGERQRGRSTLASADDLIGGVRMYNPVTGSGSALSPPLRIEEAGGVSIGVCTLGLAFEGPPMYAHGGVSAMLLDQMLGYAVSAAGHAGMTVRLDTSYRAPVPLLTPLRLTAEVTGGEGRRVIAYGAITTEADPETELVAATGTFVKLRAEQAQQLFGPVLERSDRAG
jgi:hypothetical protein